MKGDISEYLNPLKKSSNSLVAKIDIPPFSKTTGPGKSFYDYINQKWLQNVKIPKHRSKYSLETEINEYFDTYLYKIIVDSFNNTSGPYASIKKTIKALTLSIIRPEVQHFNINTLKHAIRSLSCIKDLDDVGETIGKMIRNKIPNLLSLELEINHSTGHYVISISIGELCLGNSQNYYMNNTSFKANKTKIEYLSILNLFTKDFDLTQNLTNSYDIEHSIAHSYDNLEAIEDIDIISFNTLGKDYPLIPWAAIFKGLGFKPRVDETIIINNTQWLKLVNNLFKKIPINGWISLLSTNTLIHGLFTLPEPYKTRAFDFFTCHLNSLILSPPPPEVRTLDIIKKVIQPSLSYLFVKNFLNEIGKKDAEKFTQTIIHAAIKRIEQVPWMETKGKKKAIEKIRAIKMSVFYPELKKMPHAPKVLSNNCLLENVYNISAENTNETLKLVGKSSLEEFEWIDPPYSVNAYYVPLTIIICIPAASFLFPLYDPKRIGWNYGALGATIGHEIIHAFDEQGQNFNEKGEQKPLWSSHDKRGYTKRMNEIVKLFAKEKVYSVHLRGDQTLSENLADLGGIQIALCALEICLNKMGVSKEKHLKEIREFFIGYTICWRTIVRRGDALVRVYTDPHSPAKQRVNVIIAQVDQWYEAFNIIPSDLMYVKPEDRIVVF